MKKLIVLMLAAMVMVSCLFGCGKAGSAADKNNKLKVVTTIFPEYDWVKNILGKNLENVDLTMLLDSGVDLHSYQPTAQDILKISDCDIFIYVGGESDEWVEDALKEATNKEMQVIDLLDVLGDAVKEEEVVEGMQEDHDHDENEDHDHDEDEDHDHDEDHEHDEDGEIEYDEHVWLSLKNTAILVKEISEALAKADAKNADEYKKNTEEYLASLSKLDSEYTDAVAGAKAKTVLFGDRFPFRYMVDDYGLSYYAAFVGCSAETEASFETITFLAGKVDELSLPAVLTIEGPEHKIAETVVQNTASKDQKILTMDSMQSVTSKDVENGASYLKIMEDNLSVLKEALN